MLRGSAVAAVAATELPVTKWQRCPASLSSLRAKGEGTACLGHRETQGAQFKSMGARGLGVGEEEAVTLSRVSAGGLSGQWLRVDAGVSLISNCYCKFWSVGLGA